MADTATSAPQTDTPTTAEATTSGSLDAAPPPAPSVDLGEQAASPAPATPDPWQSPDYQQHVAAIVAGQAPVPEGAAPAVDDLRGVMEQQLAARGRIERAQAGIDQAQAELADLAGQAVALARLVYRAENQAQPDAANDETSKKPVESDQPGAVGSAS